MSSSRKICVLSVQRVVFVEHVLGELGVAADEGVERVAEHALGDGRHPRDVDQLLDRRVADVAPRRLGDVDGEIADAFEVGVDLDGGDDRAQVDRHRLIERQQREAAVVDLDVERVQRTVARQDARDQIAIAVDQPLDREADGFLGEPAHFEQAPLELLELVLEMPDALFGRRH